MSFQCYLINISYFSYHLLTWIPLVLSRASNFPATYFLYFVTQIARIPSLFLKTNPFNAKTLSYAYLWVKEIAEKLEKSECWMVKWSSRNESFEDLETKEKTESGMNKVVKIGLKD